MITAAMIAMFYLGTASGVLGAVMMFTLRPSLIQKAEPLGSVAPVPDGFGRAA